MRIVRTCLIVGFVLAVLLVTGCGESEGPGPQVHNYDIDEARAMARPLGKVWNTDAVNWIVNGRMLDEQGRLVSDGTHWQFWYSVNGTDHHVVQVNSTGQTEEWDQQVGQSGENPMVEVDYTDSKINQLLGIAATEIKQQFGAADQEYVYFLQLIKGGDNYADIKAYDSAAIGTQVGHIRLIAETGQVDYRDWD
ncbi:MAG: hypothetical protein JRJ87_23410 [Deltaproteobacteria bacterium]|nr:hypothetical protein [Deltaproteobacteria bacterium]